MWTVSKNNDYMSMIQLDHKEVSHCDVERKLNSWASRNNGAICQIHCTCTGRKKEQTPWNLTIYLTQSKLKVTS